MNDVLAWGLSENTIVKCAPASDFHFMIARVSYDTVPEDLRLWQFHISERLSC